MTNSLRFILISLIASTSFAEVTDADKAGFTTVNVMIIDARRDQVSSDRPAMPKSAPASA